MSLHIVDTFAGPGGWDEGMRMLGLGDVVGIEWDAAACATAEAAGHCRIQADVAALDPLGWPCWGMVSSPPCQAWSMAGKRKGELDRANCHLLADRMAAGDDSTDWCTWEDPRSPLVCQPVRWVRDLRPEWVALEEVPAVAGLWEHFARIFRGWGYSVWTGDLCAADYGVPQTRTRRILTASRVRKVGPPPPTHSETAHGDDLLGGHTLPWVTMAEALGWAEADVIRPNRGSGFVERHGDRPDFPATRPAPVVISKSRSWERIVYVNGTPAHAARRPADEPAPTVLFGQRSNDVRWALDRPATTVVGSFRPDVIAGPGHHDSSRQDAPGSVRVTVQEAAILQSFRPDYPWDGLALADHVLVGFPNVLNHPKADELVGRCLERGVRFTVSIGGRQDGKILDGVVRPVSVDVVHDLTRLRRGDYAMLGSAIAPPEDGIPPAEVGSALPALICVERVTRQSPLLPVAGAEATGDGFAFTVVARWLGRVGESLGSAATAEPLVVHQAHALGGMPPTASFDLTSSHASSVAERVVRRTTSRTKSYEQVGNAIPPRLAAHIVASAIGIDPTAGIAAYYDQALGGAA